MLGLDTTSIGIQTTHTVNFGDTFEVALIYRGDGSLVDEFHAGVAWNGSGSNILSSGGRGGRH